jgi:hypothetical protein
MIDHVRSKNNFSVEKENNNDQSRNKQNRDKGKKVSETKG